MNALKNIIKNNLIELLIWDFDGVIFDLDWNYQSSSTEFLGTLYEAISEIDSSVAGDKDEFIARRLPYPTINELGIKHGKEAQDIIKGLFGKKETAALHRAIPNQQVIDFIKELELPQSIWSNNLSSTIEYLLKQVAITDKIDAISSLEKVILSKPSSEGFKLIRSNYPQIDLGKILFIGDSLISDKVAAENVGVNFYHYQK